MSIVSKYAILSLTRRRRIGELVDSAMDLNYWSVDDADRDGAADDDMDAASHVSQGV
jgi:hypothetical protein